MSPERNPVLQVHAPPRAHDRPSTTTPSSSCARTALWWATPLLAVLIVVETTDVLFAVDSIPAIFAVTTNTFIVFTSNAFAILGLRALYFLLADVLGRFHYLKVGLAAVLVFVGREDARQRLVPRADLGEPARDHRADRRIDRVLAPPDRARPHRHLGGAGPRHEPETAPTGCSARRVSSASTRRRRKRKVRGAGGFAGRRRGILASCELLERLGFRPGPLNAYRSRAGDREAAAGFEPAYSALQAPA